MLASYLKVAFRNIVRHRLYSLINIFGLSVGLAVAIMIALFVRHELSFDSMYADGDRIYRLNWANSSTGNRFATMFNPSAPQMAIEMEEVEVGARMIVFEYNFKQGEQQLADDVAFVDPGFFDMFDLPVIAGDLSALAEKPYALALTEAAAMKYFGTTAVVGELLTDEDESDLEVVAVIENMPANSHFTANLFTSIETLRAVTNGGGFLDNWGSDVGYHYVRLVPGSDPAAVGALYPDLLARHSENDFGGLLTVVLQPLRDIHFTPDLQNESPSRDDLTGAVKSPRQRGDIYIFAAVALLTLGIACFNFLNLQIAQATRRVKEVGVRKVLGARRGDVARQFLVESMLLAVLALAGGLALIEIFLPSFNGFANTAFAFGDLMAPGTLATIIAVALGVGALSGLYPAMFIAGFLPSRVLRGETFEGLGAARIRAGLVIAQFAISIGLFVASGVVNDQLDYAFSKPLGYDKNGIVNLSLRSQQARDAYPTLRERLLTHPDITAVAASSIVPTGDLSDGGGYIPEGGDPDAPLVTRRLSVEHGFFATYGMSMVAGREFSKDFGHDFAQFPSAENPTSEIPLILNETALKAAGIGTAEEAIGKRLYFTFLQGGVELTLNYTLVGVVKDFHFHSIRSEIVPLSFLLFDQRRKIGIRIAADNPESALAHIDTVWADLVPDDEIRRTFLDEEYSALYGEERRAFELFAVLGLVAFAIACVGLYGLASYIAETRTKEIGVRKVLGATVGNIVRLLSWQFTRLALVANVIAWPLAYLFLDDWLEGFAYRAEIGWLPFVTAAVVALGVAAGTTSLRALKAARMKPALSLRME